MKKIFISVLLFSMIFSLSGVALAQDNSNGIITPESNFYFLKKITENIQEFFTFNAEDKAKLQTTFVEKRVNEIKSILETKENSKGLEEAQERLQDHIKKANEIITNQKSKGENVTSLAKKLDESFEKSSQILKESFNDYNQKKESEAGEVLTMINSSTDDNEIKSLVENLNTIKEEKENIKTIYSKAEDIIKGEIKSISEEMEIKIKAEKAIQVIEKNKEDVLDKSLEQDLLLKFNNLINQAKSAFSNNDFEEAKGIANQVEKGMDGVKDSLIILEEAEKEKEELKRLPKKVDPVVEEKIEKIEKEIKEAKENLSNEKIDSIINDVKSTINLKTIISSITTNKESSFLKEKITGLCQKYGKSFGLENHCDCFFNYVMDNYSLEEMLNLYLEYSQNQELTEELKIILKDALVYCL